MKSNQMCKLKSKNKSAFRLDARALAAARLLCLLSSGETARIRPQPAADESAADSEGLCEACKELVND